MLFLALYRRYIIVVIQNQKSFNQLFMFDYLRENDRVGAAQHTSALVPKLASLNSHHEPVVISGKDLIYKNQCWFGVLLQYFFLFKKSLP